MNILKLKKKTRSKKGLTLVELVVTVAILSIVATMGIGVVARTITNYSTASITSQEQKLGRQVETPIRTAAFIATSIQYKNTDTDVDLQVSDFGSNSGIMFLYDKDDKTLTIDEYDAGSDTHTRLSYTGVHQITLTPRRVKQSFMTDDTKDFLYLDYKIEMVNGYITAGSTMLKGIKIGDVRIYDPDDPTAAAQSIISDPDSYVDMGTEINLISYDSDMTTPLHNQEAIFMEADLYKYDD